ncbi:protein FD isoform X2 [Medicago truncatula]|uniref:protein FD isoform X2 n=1 Tax=Medicago truncatula TaxID=3880 RepID=UPI000D2F30A4|nr:protein FD isoform X2 [Medicago truncatula]
MMSHQPLQEQTPQQQQHHLRPNKPPKNTMEDVWKDINLPSLTNHMSNTVSSPSLMTPSSLHSTINLNSLPEFHFDPLAHNDLQLEQNHHHTTTLSKVEALLSNSIERRHKRIMKNRESAARSRARKQAYIFELKKKVKSLEEENARLKRQQHLCDTASNHKQKRKGNLYRTSTAPF